MGAQKAGTTSLYDNLVKHPAVMPSDIKEVHFFDNNWQKGSGWYRGHFGHKGRRPSPGTDSGWITGEASPYYLFHPLAAERAYSLCPHAKIIVLLRNPVDRAYSHYHHEVRKKREPLTFEQALEQEDQRLEGEESRIISEAVTSSFPHQHYSYKARGKYAEQLERWLAHYPASQVLIVESSVLNRDFNHTLSRIQNFLGLETYDLPQPKRSNVGSYDKMQPATRAALEAYFAPFNEQLFQITGERYPHW